MSDWDPDLYHRFRRYREEPFRHICERLSVRSDERLVDLGCGTGEHTLALLEQAPRGHAMGLDSSPAMIERAVNLKNAQPESARARLEFRTADIGNWRERRSLSLVFSNAALQWIRDQRSVLAAAFDALEPGGRLVVQMPRNHTAPSHEMMRRVATGETFRDSFSQPVREIEPVREPDVYAGWLAEIGFIDVDVYDIVFRHPMRAASEVVEWTKATGLRPYLNALPESRQNDFLARYTEAIAEAYGSEPFEFEFRRIFLWARRRER